MEILAIIGLIVLIFGVVALGTVFGSLLAIRTVMGKLTGADWTMRAAWEALIATNEEIEPSRYSERSATYPKGKVSGFDAGSRYRVYDWVDGAWRGSGTFGPFDQKQAAIEAVDREYERYPYGKICVVDRLGNIVYEIGS